LAQFVLKLQEHPSTMQDEKKHAMNLKQLMMQEKSFYLPDTALAVKDQ
jgi:hypothetical protein